MKRNSEVGSSDDKDFDWNQTLTIRAKDFAPQLAEMFKRYSELPRCVSPAISFAAAGQASRNASTTLQKPQFLIAILPVKLPIRIFPEVPG